MLCFFFVVVSTITCSASAGSVLDVVFVIFCYPEDEQKIIIVYLPLSQ